MTRRRPPTLGRDFADWAVEAKLRLLNEIDHGPRWTWRGEVDYWARVPYWAAVRLWYRVCRRVGAR